MLYHFIKLWFKNHTDRYYYMRTTVPLEHVRAAVKFTKALSVVDGENPDYEKSLESSATYAEHMLGHYTLNAVANVSQAAFTEVISRVPLMYRNDDTLMLQWVGRQAMKYSDLVLSASYANDITEKVFGIYAKSLKKVNINQHTTQVLPLIGNVAGWDEYILTVLNIKLTTLERDVDAMEFSKVNSNLESIKKRLSVCMTVSENYNFTGSQKRIQQLHKKVYGVK